MHNNIIKNNKGMAALLVVVIIGAAALLMASSASWLGLGELNFGYADQKGKEALSLTDGCVDEALQRLHVDNNYSGGSLNFGSGSCIIIASGIGDTRSIIITGTKGNYTKKIKVDITLINNTVTINNWLEID